MKKLKVGKIALFSVLTLVLCFTVLPVATPHSVNAEAILPIIFVHGGAGSATQFQSQMMRFTSNGYPQNLIFALEYDAGTPGENATVTHTRLDAFIDVVKAQTGASKVYLIGHSRGTIILQGYLVGRPDRQANVAKLVQIDGTALATPGGIPTLAIWAGLRPPTNMPGATNVSIPNQAHVEVATSAEAFAEMYKFLTGVPPVTTQIVPETSGHVKISGKAAFFPQNMGVGDATVEIWEINGATGARIGTSPVATYAITGTGYDGGAWGPFDAKRGQHYEFVLVRPGARQHHFYFEPFIRSNHLVRLLTSPPGGVGDQMERDAKSAALVITRNKEWWGNRGAENDSLTINGVNIINAAISPQPKPPTGPPHMGVIGIFAYDRSLDGQTDLSAPIPYFYGLTFMTGADIYIPAAEPPNGTISLVLTPRGGGGKTQTITMPNWTSLDHGVSVHFNDFLEIDTTPQQVKTATGTGIASFSSSLGNIVNVTPVHEGALPTVGKPLGVTFPHGLFSLTILNLVPGSTSTVTITLPSPVPPGTQYWKFQNGKWIDCTSLLGSNDGDNVLTLTLTDGGLGDADGVANGTIFDPGGPAIIPPPVPVPQPPQPRASSLTPASMSVQYLSISPQQVYPGQPVTITTNVVNAGGQAGHFNVVLMINGQVEQSRSVSVGAWGAQPVKFTVTKTKPGTYNVDVAGQKGSFTVLGAGASTGGTSASDRMIAILIITGVLVLAVVLVIWLLVRRPA